MSENAIFYNLARLVRQPYVMFAAKFDTMESNTLKTLHMLENDGRMTAGQISENLDIKPSSVTQIINKLEQAGTAHRIKSEEDSRVTLVEITEQGHSLLSDRVKTTKSFREELFKGFTADDIEKFNTYLEKLLDNVQNEHFAARLQEVLSDDTRWGSMDVMSAHFSRAREMMLATRNPEEFEKLHREAIKRWLSQS